MDLSTIYLLVGVVMLIVNIALVFAIFTIKDNAKAQSANLAQISKDIYVMKLFTYLQAKKNIVNVEVVKKKGKYSDAKVEEEVKIVSFDEWVKDYSDSEVFKVENVK